MSAQISLLQELFCKDPGVKGSHMAGGKIHHRLWTILLSGTLLIRSIKNGKLTIAFGKNIAYSTGEITISDKNVLKIYVRESLRLKPVLLFPCPGDTSQLSQFLNEYHLDASDCIKTYLNGNSACIFFARRHGTEVVIHLANTSKGIEAIRRHKEGLISSLNHINTIAPNLQSPKPVAEAPQARFAHHIQTKVPGILGTDPDCGLQRQLNRISRTVELLTSCSPSPPQQTSSNFLNETLSGLTRTIPSIYASSLIPIFPKLNSWIATNPLEKAPIHGDLWLSNILYDEFDNPISIIDWEWFREDGFKLYDAIHFIIVSSCHVFSYPIYHALREIWTHPGSPCSKFIEQQFFYINSRTKISTRYQKMVSGIIWLNIIKRSHSDTGPQSSIWLDQMLGVPSQAFADFLQSPEENMQ